MASLYRKVSARMWGDRKFGRLSAPAPNGQTLWVYLLTGPHTTAIPGVIPCGEMAMAEAIGWPLENFRTAFAELVREGMVKADWRARLIFIPNAVRHNPPESPNVIRSWSAFWELVPECSLKDEVHQHLKGFVQGLGEGFRKAFVTVFGEVETPFPKDYGESVTGTGTGTVAGTGEGKPSPKGSSKPIEPPAALALEWMTYRKGARTEHDRQSADNFADLLAAGVTYDAILAEIKRADRPKTEAIWQLQNRLMPKARAPTGKPEIMSGVKAFLAQGDSS